MATKNKGNTAVRETWESGTRVRADIDTMELVKTGLYADLQAQQPSKGAELVTGYEVESSRLIPRRGLLGELRINLVEKFPDSTTQKPVGSIRSTIEIDMVQLDKPILSLEQFSGYPEMIELWKAGPADLKVKYKYIKDKVVYDMAGGALAAAKLMLKGTDSYLAFNPVISRTSIYKSRPTPADYGKICTPPITVPGDWVYLKTADRITQQADNTYVRTEQWTGADEWSTDLYGSA